MTSSGVAGYSSARAPGIHAFGVNAYTPGEDGTLIGEHDEAGSGEEELYIVLDGKATFEVDGETVDAPPGTFVSSGRSRGGRRPGTQPCSLSAPHPARRTRGSTGVRRGRSTASRWPPTANSATPTRSKRSAVPSSTCRTTQGLNYNYACFATLAGDTGDDTFAHLRRSVELLPRFREDARRDDDFAAVREDPRFEEALR